MPAEQDLRDRVRVFLADHDPATTPRDQFLAARFDAGLAAVHYPQGHGGLGLPRSLQTAADQEFAKAGAPPLDPARNVIGLGMAAPTIIAFGTEEQKHTWLKPLWTADEIWCQLFSEPGAGSDLAGLATRAVRDGDDWIVNGQKVWTSLAHQARWGLLLARTDPDVPKHAGLSYFVVDMHAPGVEVRPLRQLTGEAEFNEVFLTDVRIPDAPARRGRRRLARGPDDADERAGLDRQRPLGAQRRKHDRLRGRGLAAAPGTAHPRPAPASAASLGRSRGGAPGGRPPPAAARGGRARPRGLRRQAHLRAAQPGDLGWEIEFAGADGPALRRLGDCAAPGSSDYGRGPGYRYLRSKGNSIEGGTSEILRNIIAERVLGLPAEPRV